MTESIASETVLRLDFGDHPDIPATRLDRLDCSVAVSLQQVSDGTVVWSREPSDPVVIEATLADDRLSVRRPRAVELQLGAGEPRAPGEYELQGMLEHDGEAYVWPAEPRVVAFVD